MKSFQQFITEAETHDREGLGHGTGMSHRGGEKIGSERKKTEPEKKRTRAVGGGKTAPAKDYKPRKDIGTQRQRSEREQQPTRERGSASLSAKEAQRKAYKERKARESGAQTKTASQLLSKKTKAVDPKYKPRKVSGLTKTERKALYKKGERKLRDLVIDAERSKGKDVSKEKDLKHKYTSK